MKHKNYLIALLLLSSLMFSCSFDDNLSYRGDFENSQEAWANFKKIANNSYKYKVVGGSWVGFSWETTITVSNGKITKRHFKYILTEGLAENTKEEDLEWTENEGTIGSHKNVGADALTLDQIYDKAEKVWLIKRQNATVYFESKNDGLISFCGYVENNCTDDCFVGITIKSIEIL